MRWPFPKPTLLLSPPIYPRCGKASTRSCRSAWHAPRGARMARLKRKGWLAAERAPSASLVDDAPAASAQRSLNFVKLDNKMQCGVGRNVFAGAARAVAQRRGNFQLDHAPHADQL